MQISLGSWVHEGLGPQIRLPQMPLKEPTNTVPFYRGLIILDF